MKTIKETYSTGHRQRMKALRCWLSKKRKKSFEIEEVGITKSWVEEMKREGKES